MVNRRFPNILITGTPGTGKTTLCEALCELYPEKPDSFFLHHLRVGDIIKENKLYTEWDDTLKVPIFDEELVTEHFEAILEHDETGGQLVDFHSADFFPPSWFDLVIVLRAETHILYDRLKKRGYTDLKVQENIESEIFQVVLDEIKEVFDGHTELWEISNNSIDDMENVIVRIRAVLDPLCS